MKNNIDILNIDPKAKVITFNKGQFIQRAGNSIAIKNQVNNCPSGALSYYTNEQDKNS